MLEGDCEAVQPRSGSQRRLACQRPQHTYSMYRITRAVLLQAGAAAGGGEDWAFGAAVADGGEMGACGLELLQTGAAFKVCLAPVLLLGPLLLPAICASGIG